MLPAYRFHNNSLKLQARFSRVLALHEEVSYIVDEIKFSFRLQRWTVLTVNRAELSFMSKEELLLLLSNPPAGERVYHFHGMEYVMSEVLN